MEKVMSSKNAPRTRKRAHIVLISFLLAAIFLAANIFRLDVLLFDFYKNKAFEQITTTSAVRASRGVIYDANMNILASSISSWRIFISPRAMKERIKETKEDIVDILSEELSKILSLDKASLYNKISTAKTLDLTIKKNATEEEYEAINSLIKEKGLDGILFTEAISSRSYPQGTMAAHILGFTGSDGQGLYGLEYSYNDILSGKDGYYLYAKDAGGNALPGEYVDYVAPTDGYSIVTTVDSYLQSELESIVELIRENHSVTNRVCGVIMDSKSGAILAMATSSPFDPNTPFELDEESASILRNAQLEENSEQYNALKRELMEKMWSNKAVSEIYEPGSTFKIITVSSAIDSGAAEMSDKFSCAGYLNVGGWRIKCHKRQGHGSGFDLCYGLQNSCNPTMMTIAERMGADTFYEYIKAFGYLEKTGIDLPGEASGIFHDLENIGTTELATISFGQRFKTSIITQLTAVAAVANGGLLVEPYLVQRVIDKNGEIITEHNTVVRRRVISEETAKQVSEALEGGVCGEGGAKNAYVFGYEVAAKTGTSEKFDILDENGNSYLRIGSTVAYAPAGEGGIVAIIVVDEPRTSVKYGSTVAAPYISMLFEKALPYLDYPASATKPTTQLSNYRGMNIDTVTKELRELGINYKIVGDGPVVLEQTPSHLVDIYTDESIVYLYTTLGEEQLTTVPELVGKSLEEALRLLSEAGLSVSVEGVYDKEHAMILKITQQSIEAGVIIKRGEIVSIVSSHTDYED